MAKKITKDTPVKWVCFALCLSFLGACASQRPKEKNEATDVNESIEETAGPPRWLNDPMAGCYKERELCAVGEGSGAIVAELAARKSLARTFETQIKATTSVSQLMHQESDADSILSGKNRENVENRIEEITDQVLQGVEVKKIYRSSDLVYTLVGLDRYEAAKRIKGEITALDEKMLSIHQERTRSSYFRLMKHFALREKLNQRYQFLSGTFLPHVVSYEQIQSIKRELASRPVTVKVELKDKAKLKEFTTQVSQMLLDFQYKVVSGKDLPSDFVVTGGISGDKQHLNVEGFERYKFVISLFSKNAQGEKIGGLKFETIKTGRSLKHAYESAVPEMTQFLEEHFSELNID